MKTLNPGRVALQVTDQYNEKWQYDWITGDFWYALNYLFLCVICFLFRPSFNSTRYAYSELEGKFWSSRTDN
jgi:hypothetical protein